MGLDGNKMTFEISRPLTRGLESFMKLVREACLIYIPNDTSNGVFNGISGINSRENWQEQRLLGDPRHSVNNKLVVPIIQIETTRTPQNKAAFHGLTEDLFLVDVGKGKRPKRQLPLLKIKPDLDDIMYAFGEVSQERVEAKCGGLALTQALRDEDYDLSLIIADGARFIEEHNVLAAALSRVPNLTQHAKILDPGFVAKVSIASISKSTSISERDNVLGTLLSDLPGKLEFGAMADPFVR